MIDWDKVFRIPTAAELKQAEEQRLATKGEVVREYRGHDIVRVSETHYQVWKGSFKHAEFSSAWECVCDIDERLSP